MPCTAWQYSTTHRHILHQANKQLEDLRRLRKLDLLVAELGCHGHEGVHGTIDGLLHAGKRLARARYERTKRRCKLIAVDSSVWR